MHTSRIPRILARARPAFVERMRATLRITRPDPTAPVEDPDTGEVTFPGVTVYDGPGYFRYPGLAQETTPVTGGATQTESRIIVRVPHGPVFRPGDQVLVVDDPDTPQLEGTQVWVSSIDDQSQATAQRLLCTDRQSGMTAGNLADEEAAL